MADSLLSPPLPLDFIAAVQKESLDKRFIELGYKPDKDGLIAKLTERVSDGRISAGIFRSFEESGKTKESAYFAHRHIDAAHRLLTWLDQHMLLLEDQARTRRRLA